MRIETLITAVDAAGYAMVSEEDLPGTDVTDADTSSVPTHPQALALWKPVGPMGASWSSVQSHATSAWTWIAGRFVNGAAA